MKIIIKTIIGLILMMTLLAMNARAQEDAVERANDANKEKAKANQVNKDVAEFLVAAADARMMDSKEGKLAITKGTTNEIQSYGQSMVKDQALMLEKIQQLAKARNISLPSSISNEKQDGYNDLAGKQGKEFDKKFCKMMIIDHKRDVKMFENAIDLNDPEVSAFAKNYLPMIQSHLDSITAIDENTSE